MSTKDCLLDLQKLHSQLKIKDNGFEATMGIGQFVLNINGEKHPKEWSIFSPATHREFEMNSRGIPESVKKDIQEIAEEWLDIKNRGEEKGPEKNPLDNLDGFEGLPGSENSPIVDQPEEKPNDPTVNDDERAREYIEQKRHAENQKSNKKDNWSVPAPKNTTEKIPYDDGLEPAQLPAITGFEIVRPAVTASQALAAWKEFQELKKYIIEPSDVMKIQGKPFIVKSGWRKFATFYNLNDKIVEELQIPLEKGFYWKIKVVCTAPNGRQTEGVGMCASTEKNGARALHDCYSTAHTRAKNRAISDMIAAGEVSYEEMV